jgi:hypothetical protein
MFCPAQIAESLDSRTLDMMRRWAGMWNRCYNPESADYAYYGARGIRVCSEWLSFESFLAFWGHPPFDGASIGRIDNDGNYEPANCEWQNQEQQNNNTIRSRIIQWNGRAQSIRDWAKEYGIGSRRLSERLRRGWAMDRALTTPCPKGFDKELEERRCRNKTGWSVNGHLYSARSRWRRGLRLSLPTQDLLAVEGVEPTRNAQQKAATKKRRKLTDSERCKIARMKEKGATIRQIAAAIDVPRSTVHYWMQRL